MHSESGDDDGDDELVRERWDDDYDDEMSVIETRGQNSHFLTPCKIEVGRWEIAKWEVRVQPMNKAVFDGQPMRGLADYTSRKEVQ